MFNAKAKRREARNLALLRLATAIILDHRNTGRSRYLLTSAHLGVPIAKLVTDLQVAFASIGEPVQLAPLPSTETYSARTGATGDGVKEGEGGAKISLMALDVLSPAYNLRAIFDRIDASIVVVGAGRTHRRDLLDALELLRRSDVPIVGTVLDDRREVIPGFIRNRL